MFNKKIKIAAMAIIAIFVLTSVLLSEEVKTIKIKTESVQCDNCKKTIETSLKKIGGIISADVDYKKHITTVKYNPNKINPEGIRRVISKTGYAADDRKADKKAYDNLMKCCKLPKDQ